MLFFAPNMFMNISLISPILSRNYDTKQQQELKNEEQHRFQEETHFLINSVCGGAVFAPLKCNMEPENDGFPFWGIFFSGATHVRYFTSLFNFKMYEEIVNLRLASPIITKGLGLGRMIFAPQSDPTTLNHEFPQLFPFLRFHWTFFQQQLPSWELTARP